MVFRRPASGVRRPASGVRRPALAHAYWRSRSRQRQRALPRPSSVRQIKPVRYELQPCFATLRCDLSSSMDLNSYLHFYRYRDHDDRDATRRRSAADQRWASYLGQAKPLFAQQSSSIFRPAGAIMERIGADPEPEAAAERRRRLPMVELRRYRLQAGYVGRRSTSFAQSRFFTR